MISSNLQQQLFTNCNNKTMISIVSCACPGKPKATERSKLQFYSYTILKKDMLSNRHIHVTTISITILVNLPNLNCSLGVSSFMLKNCLISSSTVKHMHIFGSKRAPNNHSIVYHPGTKQTLHSLNALCGYHILIVCLLMAKEILDEQLPRAVPQNSGTSPLMITKLIQLMRCGIWCTNCRYTQKRIIHVRANSSNLIII